MGDDVGGENGIIGFGEFLGAFADAANDATRASAEGLRKLIADYFHERDGELIPKTAVMEMINGQKVRVPLVSLLPLSQLIPQKLVVETEASITHDDDKSTGIQFTQRGVPIKARIEFQSSENETLEIIRDAMNQWMAKQIHSV